LQQLKKAIGEPPLLAIHSDACKGLTIAVQDVFLHAERRECFRHLIQNYIKQFVEKEYMYTAARAYMSDVYEHHKANFAAIGGVSLWLKEYHSLLWCRSGFNSVIISPTILLKCSTIGSRITRIFPYVSLLTN
jgi:hypothetical protein